jgi:hypothetical protein
MIARDRDTTIGEGRGVSAGSYEDGIKAAEETERVRNRHCRDYFSSTRELRAARSRPQTGAKISYTTRSGMTIQMTMIP